jgi:hypothetical protein
MSNTTYDARAEVLTAIEKVRAAIAPEDLGAIKEGLKTLQQAAAWNGAFPIPEATQEGQSAFSECQKKVRGLLDEIARGTDPRPSPIPLLRP